MLEMWLKHIDYSRRCQQKMLQHAWNTMVRGYICNQLYTEAVGLFDEMQAGNVKPDFLTMAAVLSGCAHLGSLERGTKIHIYGNTHLC
jgi:pentatricopeptide repeat protein